TLQQGRESCLDGRIGDDSLYVSVLDSQEGSKARLVDLLDHAGNYLISLAFSSSCRLSSDSEIDVPACGINEGDRQEINHREQDAQEKNEKRWSRLRDVR